MRFGHWRGLTLAMVLVTASATARVASADGFGHTIPPEVLAVDLNTGMPYYAPPIPWGHYAKDGLFDHFGGSHCGICGLLRGHGAGLCGGHGLFNRCGKGGCGDPKCKDPGCGHGLGLGLHKGLKDCNFCKGKGCGLCKSMPASDPLHKALASGQSAPTAPAKVVVAAPQAPTPSPQACAEPGCKLGKGHRHGDPCRSCGGKGCGLCGGLGLFKGCGLCGGKGCGSCKGLGKGCGLCGGKGCGACLAGLKGKLLGLLHPNAGKVKYFVGPGGPVPLTPGYVPWINPVRSPRDFLAFPPYSPSEY
jgi:hypothetical protein